MTDCILLSHVFINKDEQHKIDAVNFTIQHWRRHNPNAYIILVGHGEIPNESKEYVDCFIWKQKIEKKDINVGHPYCVNLGLDHAIEKGFTKILKARADGINLLDDVCTFSNNHLKDKKILITQQTSIDRMEMGDLFMYGDIKFLKKCWNINTWYPTKTGLTSLAKNFINICKEDTWKSALINNASFINIFNLKWIDFRANWTELKDMQEQMLQNKLLDFEKYLWGSKEQWHVWDKDGNLIHTHPNMGKITTEKDWHL